MSKASAIAKFVSAKMEPEIPAPITAAADVPVEPVKVDGAPEVNPAAEAAPVVEPTKSLDSTRFASLAKKEAEIVRLRQEVNKERDSIASEKERLKPLFEKYQKFEETRSKDPVEALKIMGFSETDLINFMAGQEKPELTDAEKSAKIAAQTADDRIKAFRDEQDANAKKAQEDADAKTVANFKGGLSTSIQTDKETLQWCAYMGEKAVDLAYDFILEDLKENEGKEGHQMMSVKDALASVEAFFEEEDQKATAAIPKRQPNPEPAAITEEPMAKPERTKTLLPSDKPTPPKPVITKTRTLTNAATVTAASGAPRRQETRDEKKERLAEMLRQGVYNKS